MHPRHGLADKSGDHFQREGPAPGVPNQKMHEKGRVCEEDGCSTILSVYNKKDYCAFHDPSRLDNRRRASEEAAMAEKKAKKKR